MNATNFANLHDFIKAKEEIARRTGVQIENVYIEGGYCYVAYHCPTAYHNNMLEDIEELLGLIAHDLMTDEQTAEIYIDGQKVNVQQYLQTMQTPVLSSDETGEELAERLFIPRNYACIERMGW